jgi:hypothetical protein
MKHKEKEQNKEFDEVYEKYLRTLDSFSSGLVNTNKAEFIKMYAFYTSVIQKDFDEHMNKIWDLLSKDK